MHVGTAALIAALGAVPSHAQDVGESSASLQAEFDAALPEPVASPMAIDFSGDPVLALGGVTAEPEAFRTIVLSALSSSPVEREARAIEAAAQARLDEADARLLPSGTLDISAFRTIDREFSNDPENLIERSRPTERIDLNYRLDVPFIDFGYAPNQRAAVARLRAAGFEREARVGEVAGDVVVAWTQVFGYQALVRLTESFAAAQTDLDEAITARILRGVSAEGDRVRVSSLQAQAQVQLAELRRQLAGAEARFEQLSGFAPPDRLLRPPLLDATRITREYAQFAAQQAPEVSRADALAEARVQDARVADSAKFPTIAGRVDIGRYGLLEEGRNDYDIRATANLTWRILDEKIWARARAADADADAAGAVADRVREEAERDAVIAWGDVQALEEQVRALDAAYRAARQSRDVVVARFGALRGTLFDVADAQNVYLGAASSYIRALTELDQARYILLLRTGRLLSVLGVTDATVPVTMTPAEVPQ